LRQQVQHSADTPGCPAASSLLLLLLLLCAQAPWLLVCRLLLLA
jgi:hypothetical protein